MSTEPNEFERSEKTPAGALITEGERKIVFIAIRAFVKGAVPHAPAIAKYGVVVVGALAMLLQHWAGRITDQKVDAVKVEAQATTDRAFKGVVKPANKITVALNQALERIAKLEATTAAQSALIDAREKEFTIEGRPARARKRRVDAELVKVVRDNAAKDSKDLAARQAHPGPLLKPIPLEIPPKPTETAATAPAVVAPVAPAPPTPPADAAKP